ncbi:MAG: hypothetical protein ACTSP2_02150, partial [Alphaproteobacteria bacterium]
MSIWFFELFAPETLVRYVAVFLIVVALAMPTLVLVRVMALIGGVVGAVLAALVEVDRAGLVWWSLLTLVVLARLLLRDPRGMLGRLNPEELAFKTNVVPDLNGRQTRLLARHGKWRDADVGHVFTREGQLVNELVYLASGRVDSVVEGETVGTVDAGSLVGEIGVSTGETA